jgi:hypothetical protein
MSHDFRTQLEAVGSALLLIEKLHAGTVWALEVTNDDDAESPTVLNIFAEQGNWVDIIAALRLGKATDRSIYEKGEQFMSFRQGTLLISLIEEEDQ